jgi:AAA15 family ATPase/GTPase
MLLNFTIENFRSFNEPQTLFLLGKQHVGHEKYNYYNRCASIVKIG